MRTLRTIALAAGVALVGAVAVVSTPASADVQSFTNPLASSDPSALTITAVEVEHTPTGVALTVHTRNVDTNDFNLVVEFARTASNIESASTDALILGDLKSGATSTFTVQQRIAGTVTTLQAGMSSSVSPTGDITLTASGSNLPFDQFREPVFGYAQLVSKGQGPVKAGVPLTSGGIAGFGPVNPLSIPSSVALRLSSPSQISGRTSATLTATVSPANANGTIEIFDDGTQLTSMPVNGLPVDLVLPLSLSIGDHALTATFTPTTARFTLSTSSAIVLHVLDPNASPASTSTKLKLSKAKQHFRHSPAKLTVTVTGGAPGSVVVYDGKRKLTTLSLANGKVTYRLPKKLAVGKHHLRAVYLPDSPSTVASSTSPRVKLTVVR